MAVPIVDGINWDNFAYQSVYGAATAHHRGIFEWGFLYKESQVPQKELSKREHNSEPYWYVIWGWVGGCVSGGGDDIIWGFFDVYFIVVNI